MERACCERWCTEPSRKHAPSREMMENRGEGGAPSVRIELISLLIARVSYVRHMDSRA
jgi:hypothetical protein